VILSSHSSVKDSNLLGRYATATGTVVMFQRGAVPSKRQQIYAVLDFTLPPCGR
jgi:hypothetical protein